MRPSHLPLLPLISSRHDGLIVALVNDTAVVQDSEDARPTDREPKEGAVLSDRARSKGRRLPPKLRGCMKVELLRPVNQEEAGDKYGENGFGGKKAVAGPSGPHCVTQIFR